MTKFLLLLPLLAASACTALPPKSESPASTTPPVYVSDLNNGSYQNPILFADYSDPDVLRVGDDFYLTASSFTCFPGLPILHSKDLVNWTLIGHAITQYPAPGFPTHNNGGGVWAPSIRFHNGQFYIYFGDPDRGVFMTHATNPAGPWSPLLNVRPGKGWIDTCPLWDDDGNAYLVHAFAASRNYGTSNVLHVAKLSPDGTNVLDDGKLVLDGKPLKYTTVEGPKFYKRNGYYYLMMPGGGVSTGYQLVARSKNVYGPYDTRIVLRQEKTPTNGPHQGGWVTTQTGEDWFIHFQDDGGFGRITHLEPMKWDNDWPVIGQPIASDPSVGQPVLTYKKPNVGATFPIEVPQTSDEFTNPALGLQWQWFGNFSDQWISLTTRPGFLRMNPVTLDKTVTLFERPNLLLQKTPCDRFTATAALDVSHLAPGETTGLLITGNGTAALQLQRTATGTLIRRTTAQPVAKPKTPKEPKAGTTTRPAETQPAPPPPPPKPDLQEADATLDSTTVYLRLTVVPSNAAGNPKKLPRAVATLSYSTDNLTFTPLGKPFAVAENGWIGAKLGLFCNAAGTTTQPAPSTAPGYADINWFRFEKITGPTLAPAEPPTTEPTTDKE